MPLLGEPAVGTLDGFRIGISSNTQNFVKVTSRFVVASGHEQASAALALSVVVAIQNRRSSYDASNAARRAACRGKR
jgi:hypothetical protein